MAGKPTAPIGTTPIGYGGSLGVPGGSGLGQQRNEWGNIIGGPQIGGQLGGAESLANQLSAYGAEQENNAAPVISAPSGASAVGSRNQDLAVQAAQWAADGNTPSAANIAMSQNLNNGIGATYAAARGGQGAQAIAANSNNAAGAVQQAGAARNQELNVAQQTVDQGINNRTGASNQQGSQDQKVALAQAALDQQQLATNNSAQAAYQNMATQTLIQQLQSDTQYNLANMGDASQLQIQNINNQAGINNNVMGGALGAAQGGLTGALSQYTSNAGNGGQTTDYTPSSQGGGYDPDAENDNPNPDEYTDNSYDDTTSDERLKMDIRPMGYFASLGAI